MSKKFIPNGDLDFRTMADCFTGTLARSPERYGVSREEADELAAGVARYEAALAVARSSERTAAATRVKDEAREAVERIIRRLAQVVRANPKIDLVAKMGLGLRQRSAKAKQLPCPQEPPRLTFVRALHEGGGATPVHELAFQSLDYKPKPAGAVRLELFVDLVPPEENVPNHPGANLASRPWYLRSFTRSPIKLVPPMARVPMRVVYWGRWADSSGAVGPFSATAVGWIEGGMHKMLSPAIGRGSKPVPMLEDATPPGGDDREPAYRLAVIEAQHHAMRPGEVPQLPAPDVNEAA